MQQSAWQTRHINCMTVDFTAKQPESLRVCKSPQYIAANAGLNSYLFTGRPADIGKNEKDEEFRTQRSFFHLQTSPPTPNLYPNEQLLLSSHRHDGKVATHETPISQRKKFFIFDRSGAETRMILSSVSPAITNPTVRIACIPGNFNVLESKQARPEVNDLFDSNEDHIIGEGSDYHEDTEEINALLYSDNDDISTSKRDGGDEDEVSTGRSPLTLENDSDDEVNSMVRPSKRQKSLAFGSSNELSSMATEPIEKLPTGLYEDESVVDVNTCGEEEPHPAVGTKRSRRDTIRDRLRMLENLIPGSKSKDPLLIIEEAIGYLKSLKAKANPLHVEDPERPGCCGPPRV